MTPPDVGFYQRWGTLQWRQRLLGPTAAAAQHQRGNYRDQGDYGADQEEVGVQGLEGGIDGLFVGLDGCVVLSIRHIW